LIFISESIIHWETLLAKKFNRKRKLTTKSRGQAEVSKFFRKVGYTVTDEFYIENLPYDLYIKEYNLIIEYYGDRWHYPKDVYPSDFWDKVKNRYVWEKWEKDAAKIKFAESKGFNVRIIWEHDWKKISNKTRYIEKMINKLKE